MSADAVDRPAPSDDHRWRRQPGGQAGAERVPGHAWRHADDPPAQPAIRPPNPFATCFTRPGALPYRAVAQTDGDRMSGLVDAILWQPASAICGPHGSGKSTLVAALLPRFRQRGIAVTHRTLHDDSPLLRSLGQLIAAPRRSLLVVDGWEQLPRPIAVAVLVCCRWRGVRLLVTCHRACRGLPVVWQTCTDRSAARAMTEALLARSPEYHGPIMARFDHRWQCSRGNVRDLWFGLYDDFEALLRENPACRSD